LTSIDNIDTAAVSEFGKNMWIHHENIMRKDYDMEESHFGKLPIRWGISHYAVVILHEFGHIIRTRARRTTSLTLLTSNLSLYQCFLQFKEDILTEIKHTDNSAKVGEKRVELEECFADMFAKSFILYITQNE
jgi:hypothetical protein